jgi:transposase
VKPKKARKCYLRQKDGFGSWKQSTHAQEYMVFPENISPHLAIDESSLSQGELYTFISSRDTEGRKGKLVVMVANTRSEKIAEVLHLIAKHDRELVKEVTMDMASNMRKACQVAFPNAVQVTDRFHVMGHGIFLGT